MISTFGQLGKLKKAGRRGPSGEMSLQITSMADIFMIILVFLLKTYGSGLIDLVPPNGLLMPSVNSFVGAPGSGTDTLKVEVSKSGISVDGKPVSTIENYVFSSSDIASNGSSNSLSAALDFARKQQLGMIKKDSEIKLDSRIIIVADQKAPYATIKAVLASAAIHGYTDFKLAVVNPN